MKIRRTSSKFKTRIEEVLSFYNSVFYTFKQTGQFRYQSNNEDPIETSILKVLYIKFLPENFIEKMRKEHEENNKLVTSIQEAIVFLGNNCTFSVHPVHLQGQAYLISYQTKIDLLSAIRDAPTPQSVERFFSVNSKPYTDYLLANNWRLWKVFGGLTTNKIKILQNEDYVLPKEEVDEIVQIYFDMIRLGYKFQNE